MPKGKPPRSRRRRGRRPLVPAAPRPVAAVPSHVAAAPPGAPERTHEPSITRALSRDYSYVRREVRRIVLLASVIIIAIVVLSFFIP